MDEREWRAWIRCRVQRAHPLLWVIDGSLACSPRPLRYHERFGGRISLIPPEACDALSEWIGAVCAAGIGTVVCLATPRELLRYSSVANPESDLLALYRRAGLVVHHHPIEDPAHAATQAQSGIRDQLERLKPLIHGEYLRRTGALLIHCSGGMDRSTPIAAYIAATEKAKVHDESPANTYKASGSQG